MNDKLEALVYQTRQQHEQGKSTNELLDYLAQKNTSFIDALLIMHEVLPHEMATVQKAFAKHEHWAHKQKEHDEKHDKLSDNLEKNIAQL